MDRFITFGIGIVLLIIAANVGRYIYTNMPDPEKKNVVDGLTGNMQIQKFLDVKEKQDIFNLPAIRTSFSSFYIQHGRYPRNLMELEKSENVSANLLYDQNGVEFKLVYKQEKPILLGAGDDTIHGTTDDIAYSILNKG